MPVTLRPATPEEQAKAEQKAKEVDAIMNLLERHAKEKGIDLTVKPLQGMALEPPLTERVEDPETINPGIGIQFSVS